MSVNSHLFRVSTLSSVALRATERGWREVRLNIFLDESGSFVSASRVGSYNSIAAYMSPECDRRRLRKIVSSVKRTAGTSANSEIKLKNLSEGKYFDFLYQLSRLNGVLYAVATDAGLNHPPDVEEHKRIQAQKVVAHKDKMQYQTAREGLQTLSDRIASLAPQLYVQLHCQVNLMDAIIRNGVLYFAQRQPRSLGHFRWRIDQKNSTQTAYEAAFLTVTPAFLQSISLRQPMPMLIGADYSAFSRFDYSAEDKPTYLRDTYGIEIDDEPATNIGMLVRENLEFVDSEKNQGVQVADLLASGLRRCLRQGFTDNNAAASFLGRLMVQNYKGKPPIQLLGFSKSGHAVDGPVTRSVRIMEAGARAMLAR